MSIPYRVRQFHKRLFVSVLILAVVIAVVVCVWFFWLQRFVVYGANGGVFNFDVETFASGEQIRKPEPAPTVPIIYADEEEEEEQTSTDLAQMIGYYIDAAALADIATVRTQLEALEPGTPVMVDVKNIYGSFYYSSAVSAQRDSSISTTAMDALISLMQTKGLYAIARLPGLRDYYFGLHHVPDGLPTPGGYLWADEYYCYWLDPTSAGTVSYLIDIVNELKGKGFDEVVFYDFHFPDTDGIVFEGDKQEAIATAASTLVTTCSTETFAVSFTGLDATFPLPQGRSRLYLTGVAAADAAAIAQQAGVTDPAIHLVFLTEVHDTRFDAYSVLRPLSAAH